MPEFFLELEASPVMLTGGASVEGVVGYEEIPSPAPDIIIPGGGI